MQSKKVILIGVEPKRMTRLMRTHQSLKALGVDVRVFQPSKEPSGSPRVLKGIIRYIVICIQVLLSKADIYHFYNVPDVVGVPLCLKRGVFVYDVRSPWFSSIRETLGSSLLSSIAYIIERIMTRAADVVLAANYPLAHRARRFGAKRVIVVPNYPPAEFGRESNREDFRALLELGASPTVLYVGKLSILEGSELLKSIIQTVSESRPDVKFLIVGDGPQRESIERFILDHNLENQAIMVGWVSHERVADYISASDLCLFPRNWTSFSEFTAPENILKVGEYLALGKPVIAPKMGGFTNAKFPVIAVAPSEMGQAVIDYLNGPPPADISTDRPTWEISHNRLSGLYSSLGAIPSE